jgi:predicted nucleic acid-binding Zn ribbon protein
VEVIRRVGKDPSTRALIWAWGPGITVASPVTVSDVAAVTERKRTGPKGPFPVKGTIDCERCGTTVPMKTVAKRWCSERCRVAAFRARKKEEAEGVEFITEWPERPDSYLYMRREPPDMKPEPAIVESATELINRRFGPD